MKKLTVIAISLLVIGTAFAAGFSFGKKEQLTAPVAEQQNTTVQRAKPGSAVLYAKIQELKPNQQGTDVTFRLVEWTQGDDNSEQAALESGQCSLDKIENDECLPNNFFIRDTDKSLTLPLSSDAEILVLSPGPSGEIKLDANHNTLPRNISVVDLTKMLAMPQFASTKPFIITTTHGVITKIQEQYVP